MYIDDVLITGSTEQEHLQTLNKVLSRLSDAGLKLKQTKCSFMQPSVECLGHNISADGIRPTEEKTCAIQDAPVPNNESATVFSGPTELLQKVLAQPFQCLSSSPQTT